MKVSSEIDKVLQRHKHAWDAVPWCDPATIPCRQHLFGLHYTRRNIGATIGAGGRGKTTLGTTEAVSMSIGRNLFTGELLKDGPLRVWVLNAEEDQDEMDRRFAACCQHYGISCDDLGDRLFVQSIRDRPWRIATLNKTVPTINQAVIETMRDFIAITEIDVFMLDPFISFHSVNESANADMDLVIKEGLGAVAQATNSACEIFHHPGKPKPGQETTVEDGRGASAIIWAVRSARVLNFMTPDEADKIGISEIDRRRYVKIANGKANMGPTGGGIWMRLAVENLANGDQVVCSTLWEPPDPFAGLSANDMKVAQKLAQGGAYRADIQSPKWFGFALADHLKVNVRYGCNNAAADVARLKSIIKVWLHNKVLDIEEREDEKRKKRRFIIPGTFRDPDRTDDAGDDSDP